MRKTFLSLIRPGLAAVTRFWKPFVLIQFLGMLVVVGYFRIDFIRNILDQLAEWKAAGGNFVLTLTIAMIASLFSGAVAPEIAKVIALGQIRFDRQRFVDFAYNAAIFGTFGIFGDIFYTYMGIWFPPDGTLLPIVIKTSLDQFVYSPFLTLPIVALIFTCRRNDWNLPAIRREIGIDWYLKRVVGLILLCWCYWIPMCTLMYVLPSSLTFVFAMFAQAAWALLLVFAAGHVQTPEPHLVEAPPIVKPNDPEVPALQQ